MNACSISGCFIIIVAVTPNFSNNSPHASQISFILSVVGCESDIDRCPFTEFNVRSKGHH